MAILTTPRSQKPAYSAIPDLSVMILRCEANDTSAPDAANPSNGTWAYDATGILTYTFDPLEKPAAILAGLCYVEEAAAAALQADFRYVGYVSSTGVATFQEMLQVANAGTTADGGEFAASALNNVTLVAVLFYTNSGLNTL